jgi:hypothetical protein
MTLCRSSTRRVYPFGDEDAYRAWRDAKLAEAPSRLEDLVVEIARPGHPSPAEAEAIRDRVRRSNMAIYVHSRGAGDDQAEKDAVRAIGVRFGLVGLDRNPLADDDGITPLAVAPEGTRTRYIPYTDRPIAWHTDGYYNPPERRIRGMILHCVRPAARGGENRLMDPDMLYIQLREADPAHIDALTRPDAMTIPGNDEEGLERPDTVGPVFWDDDGWPAMRYTARSRNVVWADAPEVAAAADAIRHFLGAPNPHIFRARLEAGWGVICNNVLHTRERFEDGPDSGRLLYRARYHDRIAGG